MKVCKFGGSSVKDASQIKKVVNIIKDDSSRKVIVVSAPGRDERHQQKITDHLLNFATDGEHFSEQKTSITKKESFDAIIQKYESLCNDLKIDKQTIIDPLKKELETTTLKDEKKEAFCLSRGEHHNAKVIEQFMKKEGINVKLMLPESFGFLLSEEFIDGKVLSKTHENIQKTFLFENDTI